MFCQLKKHVFSGSICIFSWLQTFLSLFHACWRQESLLGSILLSCCLTAFWVHVALAPLENVQELLLARYVPHMLSIPAIAYAPQMLWTLPSSHCDFVLQPCFRGRSLGRWQTQVWVSVTWWRSWELRWLWQRAGICGQNLLTRMVHRLNSLGRQLLIPLGWPRLQIWCIGL